MISKKDLEKILIFVGSIYTQTMWPVVIYVTLNCIIDKYESYIMKNEQDKLEPILKELSDLKTDVSNLKIERGIRSLV